MSLSRGPDVAGPPGTPFTNAASRIDGDRAAYAVLEDGRFANHRQRMRLFVNLHEGRVAEQCMNRIPMDLMERKLAEFQRYYNAARSHGSLDGRTPLTFAGGHAAA